MGLADTVTKAYMKENTVFADAFNYLIYGGKTVVNPTQLKELDTTEIAQPFFIAGGLNEGNVVKAIQHFTPYAVDVSSGVETDGQKDHEKIRRFIERVKHGISGTK